MEESKFLIITGMSGAGKTQVVRTLEDMNFFCRIMSSNAGP